MILIKKSATADTRTCDFSSVTKATLLESSRQHIGDVVKGLTFFIGKLTAAAGEHDYDKLTGQLQSGFHQKGALSHQDYLPNRRGRARNGRAPTSSMKNPGAALHYCTGVRISVPGALISPCGEIA